MSTFARTFPNLKQPALTEQVLDKNPWFTDMLLFWRPAGDALHRDMPQPTELLTKGPTQEEDPERLRLAIRHGYINLYRGGQSIANIDFDSKGNLQAKIHNMFVNGEQGSGQTYVTLNATGLRDEKTGSLGKYKGLADLRRWVSNANQYVDKEKRFVDRIVARNPNVVDLEMALPDYEKEKTAPRMDLVALEKLDDRWRIVFWEAKLVTNSYIRSQGDVPNVVGQLAKYTHWLRYPGYSDLVTAAYQDACQLLVKFHEMARRVNTEIEELGAGIIAAGARDALPLLIDDEPRVLIDNHTQNIAFRENGHLKKLRDKPCCLQVQMVDSVHDMTLEALV